MIRDRLSIQLVTYRQALMELQLIRRTVFQEEQGVDPALEFDGYDDDAEHFLAILDDQPLGTLRIRYLPPFTAKIERLAVLKSARGQGIGKALMEAAVRHIQSQPQWEWIHLNAQIQARALYEKLGFQVIGEVFEEAGIPHIQMVKFIGRSQP
jgi:predicted GNAT family N-acyltransferase